MHKSLGTITCPTDTSRNLSENASQISLLDKFKNHNPHTALVPRNAKKLQKHLQKPSGKRVSNIFT